MKHKYHAKPTMVDNIRFDSKAEAAYYHELLLRKKTKEVVFFLRQVPFHLPGNVKYKCDFMVFYTNGEIEFIDVKGFETSEFKMKKKMVEDIYPVEIKVVKLGRRK